MKSKTLCIDGRAHRFGQIRIRGNNRYGQTTDQWTFRKRIIKTDSFIDGSTFKTEAFSDEMYTRLFCRGCGTTKTILAVPAELKEASRE